MKISLNKPGRLVAMLLFGLFQLSSLTCCSPRVISAEEMPAEESTAVSLPWASTLNCTVCHELPAASMTNDSLMKYHTDLICTDCHNNEEALANAHANLTYASKPELEKLKKTSMDITLCTDCHDDWAGLSEKTANVTVLTDNYGTTVNPHTITTHVNENGQHDDITCDSCHIMHTENPIEESSSEYCQSCHHKNVYECGTCH